MLLQVLSLQNEIFIQKLINGWLDSCISYSATPFVINCSRFFILIEHQSINNDHIFIIKIFCQVKSFELLLYLNLNRTRITYYRLCNSNNWTSNKFPDWAHFSSELAREGLVILAGVNMKFKLPNQHILTCKIFYASI